jgi:acyl-CoA synthetase (AMP-forming)/AMP-acid ligase II
MPLYHSSAALLGFCTCLCAGSTFVIGHRFSTRTFWPEVRASKATVIQYVGETCRYLLGAPSQIDPVSGENLDKVHHVRVAFGNGLRPDIWNRFKERFGIDTIAEFYAATESPSGCWNMSSNDFAMGAIGRNGMLISLLQRASFAIVELSWETEVPMRLPNGRCRRVPVDAPGELLYTIDARKIEKRFQGYFNNSQASEGKILRDVFKPGDAWFRTGDVIRLDATGRWYFCDRIGDTFRWKSENVSTAEVSEVLGAHPAVREANVYGVELPHHDGRAGCVAVMLGTREATQEVLDGIATLAQDRLPRYAVPLFLRVVREMRATGNNKQQKHCLRAQGVDPSKVRREVDGDRIYWLKEGRYVELREDDWEDIEAGKVKL